MQVFFPAVFFRFRFKSRFVSRGCTGYARPAILIVTFTSISQGKVYTAPTPVTFVYVAPSKRE